MVTRIVKEFGRLDFCHNNAGICIHAPAEEMTYEQWSKVININLNGIFLTDIAAGKSKAGVIQLAKSLAIEWAKRGVRVNSISPGYIKRSLMFFSVLLYIAGDLLIYLGRSSAACLLIGLVITGLGIYGIFGITFAMQPDVIDYSEYKKNASVSGLIAAFQGFFVKGGMGLTSFIIGAFLKKRRLCGKYCSNGKSSFLY